MKLNEKYFPYVLLLPLLLYILLFFFNPFFNALKLAFFDENNKFTLIYFRELLRDPRFFSAIKYTLMFAVTIVPLQLITAFLIALFINRNFKGSKTLLFICSIPLAISDLAAGLIFLSIFTEHGFLNSFFYFLGLIKKPVYFLSYENIPLLFTSILIAEHWRATAIVLIILIAGLQMIEKDYIDAANVFGANFFKRIFYIIIPLLKPSIQSALIIRTLFAFQMFAVVIALAGDMIPVLSGETYFWYYIYRNSHIASCYAVVIIILSLLLTAIYLKFLTYKEPVYENI